MITKNRMIFFYQKMSLNPTKPKILDTLFCQSRSVMDFFLTREQKENKSVFVLKYVKFDALFNGRFIQRTSDFSTIGDTCFCIRLLSVQFYIEIV